jgi:hypothetical protein
VEALTLAEVLGWVRDLGTIAVLTIIVWGAINERPAWVPGPMHRQQLQEKDDYCTKALKDKDDHHARELRSYEERDHRDRGEREAQFRRVLEERDAFRDELFSMAGLANRATTAAVRANRVAERVTAHAMPGGAEEDDPDSYAETRVPRRGR